METSVIDVIAITSELSYVKAEYNNEYYEMYVEANDDKSDYRFYYLNAKQPAYDDFEYEVLCNL